MKQPRSTSAEDDLGRPGPFDPGEAEDLWFLPPADDATAEDPGDSGLFGSSPRGKHASLVDADGWRAGEAARAKLSGGVLEAIVAAVPEAWLGVATREGYVDYFRRRLEAADIFTKEALGARAKLV